MGKKIENHCFNVLPSGNRLYFNAVLTVKIIQGLTTFFVGHQCYIVPQPAALLKNHYFFIPFKRQTIKGLEKTFYL